MDHGILFPSLAAAAFAAPRIAAAAPTSSGWGTALITIGLLEIVAASDVAKYGGLAWAFAVGFLLAAIDLAYYWCAGAHAARQVLVPVVLNGALAIWIWSVRPKRA